MAWKRQIPAPRIGLLLPLVIGLCGACGSDARPSRSYVPLPDFPISPSPPPALPPHRVTVMHDPDHYNAPAARDADGAYLLHWGGEQYCIWLDEIPSTPAGHCREYPYTFSWVPLRVAGPELWAGGTYNRGCHVYPNPSNPGPCFQTPTADSVSPRQSITIVGRERAPNGAVTEMFRTELAIRFAGR